MNFVTGGRLKITAHEPGAVLAAGDEWDGVQTGALDGATADPVYNKKAFGSVAGIFVEFAASPNPDEFAAWYMFGDGTKLQQELIDRTPGWDNVLAMGPFAANGAEVELVTNKRLNTIDDYQGLKVRVFGDWGKILEKIGAEPVYIDSTEIYQSLDRGVIDAAECSDRAYNLSIGLHEVAKLWYGPGVHAPASIPQLILNRESWAALPDDLKELVRLTQEATLVENMLIMPILNAVATSELTAAGVEFVEVPIEIQAFIIQKADELWESYAAEDEFFAKVYNNQRNFVTAYADVVNMQQPKVTMLRQYGK